MGGDHTIAFPLLKAVNKVNNGPVALVHFDAHLDTWDTYFGAPYTHGTPFRRAREENLFLDDASMHVGIRGPLYSRDDIKNCLLYTSPSPRDVEESRMPSSA